MSDLDPRLHVFRPDLADARLRGQVEAERFVDGVRMRASSLDGVPLLARPEDGLGMDAEGWPFEPVLVFERRGPWSWVQRLRDGYVGYTRANLVADDARPTHRVAVARTVGYDEPDMKRRHASFLSLGQAVRVVDEAETRGMRYLRVSWRDGPDDRASDDWLVERHLRPMGARPDGDWVDQAALLLGTPYLWGGETGAGLDCSGLITLALSMFDRPSPRDSDLQFAGLGEPIGMDDLRRGALVFWRGHVGIMEDRETLLHANGHTMNVAREPLAEAVERIGYLYGGPVGARYVEP